MILDEAYVEFNALQDPDESLDLLKTPPEPGRCCAPSRRSTASAACAWATRSAPEEFRLAVDRVRQPFSVNALAQAAATEALNHQDEVERRVEQTAIERIHVESELEERGLETTDSQANFSWVSLGDRDEDEIVDGLAKQGVIVRAGSGARAGGLDARHVRHPPGERPLPRRSGPIGLSLLQRPAVTRLPALRRDPSHRWYWRFS